MLNDLTNITHSIDTGFIRKSEYKPNARALASQVNRLIERTRNKTGADNKTLSNLSKKLKETKLIDPRSIRSAAIFVRIKKEDSLSMVLVFL